jgi:hypothetical protein
MPNIHKHFLLVTVIIFLAMPVSGQSLAMTKPPEIKASNITTEEIVKNTATKPVQITKFCPQIEELTKKGDFWVTTDNKWKNFTPSSATKVLNFLGAQWVGIKVGKIICLYQTNEAVAFPLSLEQLISQPIPEPSKLGWSALVDNRKFCKSTNVADCPYLAEPQQDNRNIYKEIEYNPSSGV